MLAMDGDGETIHNDGLGLQTQTLKARGPEITDFSSPPESIGFKPQTRKTLYELKYRSVVFNLFISNLERQ